MVLVKIHYTNGTNKNIKTECGVLTTNTDLHSIELIDKWGWQVPLIAKNKQTTKTVNSNEGSRIFHYTHF